MSWLMGSVRAVSRTFAGYGLQLTINIDSLRVVRMVEIEIVVLPDECSRVLPNPVAAGADRHWAIHEGVVEGVQIVVLRTDILVC